MLLHAIAFNLAGVCNIMFIPRRCVFCTIFWQRCGELEHSIRCLLPLRTAGQAFLSERNQSDFDIRLKWSPTPPQDHMSDTVWQVRGQELLVTHAKEECICRGDRLCEKIQTTLYTLLPVSKSQFCFSGKRQNEGLEKVIRAHTHTTLNEQ